MIETICVRIRTINYLSSATFMSKVIITPVSTKNTYNMIGKLDFFSIKKNDYLLLGCRD